MQTTLFLQSQGIWGHRSCEMHFVDKNSFKNIGKKESLPVKGRLRLHEKDSRVVHKCWRHPTQICWALMSHQQWDHRKRRLGHRQQAAQSENLDNWICSMLLNQLQGVQSLQNDIFQKPPIDLSGLAQKERKRKNQRSIWDKNSAKTKSLERYAIYVAKSQ